MKRMANGFNRDHPSRMEFCTLAIVVGVCHTREPYLLETKFLSSYRPQSTLKCFGLVILGEWDSNLKFYLSFIYSGSTNDILA